MKTAKLTTCEIHYITRSGARIILNRILQASVIISKYSYWLLSIFIFFSCQKNITQTNDSTNIISQQTQKPVEKAILIDSAEYPFSNHIPLLSLPNCAVYKKIQDKMNRFYQANSFRTKWMETDSPNPLYYALIDRLKNADQYGLSAETYRVDHIEQHVNTLYKRTTIESRDIIEADIMITETFFHFAIHLKEGRINDPGHGDKIWIKHNHRADHSDVTALASAKNSRELDEVIKQLQPANDQYVKLQKTLILYRALEKFDLRKLPVSAGASIKSGNRHAAIPAIRKKLSLMDIQVNWDGENIDSLYYDNALVSAVKIFQQRNGLVQDGIIGGKTLIYLNQSFKEKADLIALNMERMRWLPENYAAQYIRVNIPEYKLRIYEQGNRTLEMNVIVGAVSNATPVFIDTLEYIVFSPTWTVPSRIIKEEFVPRLKRDRMYYSARKNFTFYKNGVQIDPSTERWDSAFNVHNYRIVQQPGPDNALGLAKFIMPNNMNIYLHDTPDHKPFSYNYRALSHGCIRLDDPAKFAAYLLQEELGWNLANIKKAMNSNKPTKILLKKQYEVHLEYNTVWADDEGNLHFREDIYGYDKKQLERLYAAGNPANLLALR